MFDRFTSRAVRVLFHARSHVGQLGSSAVGPEHILLGVLDTGFCLVGFSAFMGHSPDAPMFPLDAFAVHSVPFVVLVNWFEEILGGQVIDETGLPGIYGFELKERVNTPDAFMQLLRDEAGLVIARQRREAPTLIVRQRSA